MMQPEVAPMIEKRIYEMVRSMCADARNAVSKAIRAYAEATAIVGDLESPSDYDVQEDRCLMSATPMMNDLAFADDDGAIHDMAVDSNSDGDMVAVWASEDSSHEGAVEIWAKVFYDGNPTGEKFLVNTTTDGDHYNPDVALDDDGNFVVVWEGSGKDSVTGQFDDHGIFGRLFNADGIAQGGEFLVNHLGTQGDQTEASVDMNADGDFVVAWSDLHSGKLSLQRYDLYDGETLDHPVHFGQDQVDSGTSVDVAIGPNGEMVAVWDSGGQGHGVLLDSDGTLSDVFAVGMDMSYQAVSAPSVDMGSDGSFVVAYSALHDGTGDWDIFAQRYDSDGLLDGDALHVYDDPLHDQSHPDVQVDGNGSFFIRPMTFFSFVISIIRARRAARRSTSA